MEIQNVPKFFKIASETSFFSSESWEGVLFNCETKIFVAYIRARECCCKVVTHKKSNFCSYSFQSFRYRPERYAMNNDMLNSQIENLLFTRKKSSVTKSDLQNFKQHLHHAFFAEKVGDRFYIKLNPTNENYLWARLKGSKCLFYTNGGLEVFRKVCIALQFKRSF